jgi:hypothetical protein
MGNGDIKAELRRTWEAAAPGWAKWENVFAGGPVDVIDTMLNMGFVPACESSISPVELVAKVCEQRSELARRGGW